MNYLDKLKHLTRRPEIDGALQVGDRIEWERADLTRQTGLVDDIHVDETGTLWAFVTIGESWAAVNLKFATHLPMSRDAGAQQSEGA